MDFRGHGKGKNNSIAFDPECGNISDACDRKDDNRLFPETLLYCEGMPRPSWRGMLHLLCTILLPFGMWHLMNEANGSILGQIAAVTYVSGQLFCCLFSSLYHVGNWSPATEILLQKLDHCGIAICSAAINLPCCLVLLPRVIGIPFGTLSVGFCAWTCWNIVALNRPGVWRLVLTASVIAPFLPFLAMHFTTLEISSCLANCVFQGIGCYIFSKQKPDPWPKVSESQ